MTMHVAIYRRAPGVLDTLLAGPGGEVAANTKDTKGATPLHIACRKKGGAAPEAMAMLGEGCPVKVDVTVVDDAGRTPLADATHHGHVDVVKVRRGLRVLGFGEGRWGVTCWWLWPVLVLRTSEVSVDAGKLSRMLWCGDVERWYHMYKRTGCDGCPPELFVYPSDDATQLSRLSPWQPHLGGFVGLSRRAVDRQTNRRCHVVTLSRCRTPNGTRLDGSVSC